jgi:hypothetical protein
MESNIGSNINYMQSKLSILNNPTLNDKVIKINHDNLHLLALLHTTNMRFHFWSSSLLDVAASQILVPDNLHLSVLVLTTNMRFNFRSSNILDVAAS